MAEAGAPQKWLEVSLTVDGELAESVAEVLARFIPDGVVIESTAVTAEPDDSEGHAVGPLRVFGYLPFDGGLEDTRRRLEEALWYLGRIRPLPDPQFRPVEQANWAEAWKVHYRPIAIGRRLMIVPAWMEPQNPERLAIKIDPGMAFGTGTHPTTQLCLELLEEIAGRQAGEWDVIDVGCGTSILAIAALKLGAWRALGVDIDADSIRASQENALTNGEIERLELGLGSLEDVRAEKFSFSRAQVVLANILAPVLARMLDDGLGSLLLPGGSLVLSGILLDQVETVEAAAARNGLAVVDQRLGGPAMDWVALELKIRS